MNNFHKDFEQVRLLRQCYFELYNRHCETHKCNNTLLEYFNNYSFCMIIDFDVKYKDKIIPTPLGNAILTTYMWEGTCYCRIGSTYHPFNYKQLG